MRKKITQTEADSKIEYKYCVFLHKKMSQNICNGDGICLEQIDCNNGYKKHDNISCNHNCQPVKCPNYIICGRLEPQYILWCHKGVCMSPCGILFHNKHLQFFENIECPICLETKICVKQLHCDHKICTDCFKRCHLPPYWNDPEPEFPYDSELEDEYYSHWENPRWRNDPLIQKYERDSKNWEIEREIREANESYLKVCSICRK